MGLSLNSSVVLELSFALIGMARLKWQLSCSLLIICSDYACQRISLAYMVSRNEKENPIVQAPFKPLLVSHLVYYQPRLMARPQFLWERNTQEN